MILTRFLPGIALEVSEEGGGSEPARCPPIPPYSGLLFTFCQQEALVETQLQSGENKHFLFSWPGHRAPAPGGFPGNADQRQQQTWLWDSVWPRQWHYKGLPSPQVSRCWWDCSLLTPAQKWLTSPPAAHSSGDHRLWEMPFLSLLLWPWQQWHLPILYRSLSGTSSSASYLSYVQYPKWWFLFHGKITDRCSMDSLHLSCWPQPEFAHRCEIVRQT